MQTRIIVHKAFGKNNTLKCSLVEVGGTLFAFGPKPMGHSWINRSTNRWLSTGFSSTTSLAD